MVNASHFSLTELNWSLKSLPTFGLFSIWIPPRYTMANNAHLQSGHAWSFIIQNNIAMKLEKLGLTLNHPGSALIFSRCKYALQPSSVRVSRHLAARHNVPLSDRTGPVTYIDSLHLHNPNLLNGQMIVANLVRIFSLAGALHATTASSIPKASGLSNDTSSAIT